MPRVKLPNGQVAEFPEGMAPEKIEATIQQQFPPSGAKVEAKPPNEDIVGLVKRSLISERKPGEMTAFGETDLPGRFVRSLVPGSIPEAVTTGVSMIPGIGWPARAALSMGGTAAAEKLAGRKATMPTLESGLSSIVGSAMGGAGNVLTKVTQAAWDRTAPKLAASLAAIIPEFGAKTPEGTVSRIITGEGLQAVGRRYDQGLTALFKTHGDPKIWVPQLEQLTGDPRAAGGLASVLRKRIKDGLGRAFDRGDSEKIALYQQAQADFEAALSSAWGTDARAAFGEIAKDYRKASEITNWFTQGKGRVSQSELERLRPAEGKGLSVPEIQGLFHTARGSLKRALSPEEYQSIMGSLRLGEETLGRDVPGQGLSLGAHLGLGGASLYGRHLPRAPKLTGETISPEMVGTALRALGTQEIGSLAESAMKGQ